MKFEKDMLLLYAVTDNAWVGEQTLAEQIEDAIKGGATIVQLREKKLDKESFIIEAIEVVKICHKYNVPLIINDDVDVALKSGADGVHVGIEDTPVSKIREIVPKDFIIGATCKTVEQAMKAQKDGADYMGVGAVFVSPTKTNAIRITKEQLREIVLSVDIPAVAIGGITKENALEIKGCNIAGIAVVSAIFGAKDIKTETALLKKIAREVID